MYRMDMNYVSLQILKAIGFIIISPILLIVKIIQTVKEHAENKEIAHMEKYLEEFGDLEEIEPEEEIPEFYNYMYVNDNYGIGIEKIEHVPHETAFIRIVENDKWSKQYKVRVKSNKYGKYIIVSDNYYYLKEKTNND